MENKKCACHSNKNFDMIKLSEIEQILVVVANRWGNNDDNSTISIVGQKAKELILTYNIDWEKYK